MCCGLVQWMSDHDDVVRIRPVLELLSAFLCAGCAELHAWWPKFLVSHITAKMTYILPQPIPEAGDLVIVSDVMAVAEKLLGWHCNLVCMAMYVVALLLACQSIIVFVFLIWTFFIILVSALAWLAVLAALSLIIVEIVNTLASSILLVTGLVTLQNYALVASPFVLIGLWMTWPICRRLLDAVADEWGDIFLDLSASCMPLLVCILNPDSRCLDIDSWPTWLHLFWLFVCFPLYMYVDISYCAIDNWTSELVYFKDKWTSRVQFPILRWLWNASMSFVEWAEPIVLDLCNTFCRWWKFIFDQLEEVERGYRRRRVAAVDRERAKAHLIQMLSKGNAMEIEEAYRAAEACDVDARAVSQGKAVAELLRKLNNTIKCEGRLDTSACQRISKSLIQKLCEVGIIPLENQIQRVARVIAERNLHAAMVGKNQVQVTTALAQAEAHNVNEITLQAARERINFLKAQASLTATQRFVAAFAVGQVASHNKLAHILGKVLADHGASASLPLLLEHLEQNSSIVDARYSRAFPKKADGANVSYGQRGDRPYFRPEGWLRFSFNVKNFHQYKNWRVAYHGTSSRNVLSILLRGLQRPGDDGVAIAHGQAYSQTGRTIYMSPSIEYAAFPVYAQLFELGEAHWAQLVLQCRVRPDAVMEKPGSLGGKHWPRHLQFDPNFTSHDGLEWLIEDSRDVVVYGLMVREFGPMVDASIYGSAASMVREGKRGPEFEWTRLRAQHLEEMGFQLRGK